MFKVKQFIITVLLLAAIGLPAIAQNLALNPYEGATHTYAWNGLQDGMEYEFYLTANADGTGVYDEVLTAEFDFLTTPTGVVGVGEGIADVDIAWNDGASLLDFYVWVQITVPGGCSNYRYVGVVPQPNNRSLQFDITASTECFDKEDNGFSLPFSISDNNGQALSAAYFPMALEYTINGVAFSELVQYDNQVLPISEDKLTLDPTINNDLVVEVTQVSDVKNAPIPDLTNASHTRTIFALPEIEFTEELRRKYNLYYEAIIAYNNSDDSRVERMEPE